MLRHRLTQIAVCATLGWTASCGDGIECPAGFVAFVTSLHDGGAVTAAQDVDPVTPGLQIDVQAQTNLSSGSLLELTVTGGGGSETYMAMVGEDGKVAFAGVTIPDGAVEVSLEGADEKGCGTVEATISVDGFPTNDLCAIALEEGTVMRPAYVAPVLNKSTDSDPDTADFQAHVLVSSASGAALELFELDASTGGITVLGNAEANADGDAQFAVTLGQGTRGLWARCTPPGHATEVSAISTFFIDTVPPDNCSLDFPLPGQFLTPDDDDDDISNGIQIAMAGSASAVDDDVEGQATEFSVGDLDIDGTALSAGAASALASFGSPGDFAVAFTVEDRAGNTCTAQGNVTVDLEGCAIAHVAPVDPVTADTNPLLEGFQTNIEVQIDAACEGQPVTTTCGAGATGVVGTGGTTILEVTLGADPSEGAEDCRTEVTATSGYVTFADAEFVFDNRPPFVALHVTDPLNLPCGSQISDADDVDPGTAGVQITVNVQAPLAAEREIIVNDGTPITNLGPGDEVDVTLVFGQNNIEGVGRDIHGNQATSLCEIILVDIAVGFSPPIDDGLVGIPDDDDNDVSGGLTLDLVGTVSLATATVDVSIDFGPDQTANVVGTTWTLPNQTLSEGLHNIQVSATDGPRSGGASLDLLVDLTPPDAATGLAVLDLTRQSVQLSFVAPNDAVSYVGWFGTVPLTDANVDIDGIPIEMPVPSAPGETDFADIDTLRAGVDYYFAVASIDAAGNRSLIATDGPNVLAFDETPPRSPPNGLGEGFGFKFAHGDFNGDGFQDVAVGVPFATISGADYGGRVHVYFGGTSGLAAAPDVTIEGLPQSSYFGLSLVAMRWDGDGFDDLVVGAPLSEGINGQVFVFSGGASFAPTSYLDASVVIGINPANPGDDAFNVSGLGWTLASGRFDGDNLDDLAIGAVNADQGAGGVVIIYGGSTVDTILLSETIGAGLGDAAVHFLHNPNPAFDFWLFGFDLFNVGRTEGAADARDDLAIGYYTDFAVDLPGSGIDERMYILRGRATRPNVGLLDLSLNASDLTIVHSGLALGEALGEHVTSIDDQNGDGRRDLVLSASGRNTNGTQVHGRVYLVNGGLTGTVNFTTPGVLLTEIQNSVPDQQFGAALITGNGTALADIDNDGLEDLVVAGGRAPDVALYVWFGGSIPTGVVTATSADLIIPAPATFENNTQQGQPAPLNGIWVDVNDDGLDDICWADHRAGAFTGSYVVLWDQPVP